MKFTKMNGLGNDYIYIECLEQDIENPSQLAVRLSDRHFGIGGDGLVLIRPSQKADFTMDMYNADGTQAEMCGNAIRCVGKLVYDKGLTDQTTLTIETLAGMKTLELQVENGKVETVTVDMGQPILTPADIPVDFPGENVVQEEITVEGTAYRVTCVSMGNPHAVLFFDPNFDLTGMDLTAIGPKFEHHPLFPQRINTEFAKVVASDVIEMRVWERGTGETWACGTGACATLVAAVLCGLSDREATLRLRGGDLHIRWDEQTGHVFMTGPATVSFTGEFDE